MTTNTKRPATRNGARRKPKLACFLRIHREAANMSASRLAKLAGTTSATISEAERGCDLMHSTVVEIVKVLGVPADVIWKKLKPKTKRVAK